MSEYIAPEAKIISFSFADVITTSFELGVETPILPEEGNIPILNEDKGTD